MPFERLRRMEHPLGNTAARTQHPARDEAVATTGPAAASDSRCGLAAKTVERIRAVVVDHNILQPLGIPHRSGMPSPPQGPGTPAPRPFSFSAQRLSYTA